MAAIDFDKLVTNNQNAKVIITGFPQNNNAFRGITAFVTSELSISGGNQYSNPLLTNQQESISNTLQNAQALIGNVASKFGYNGIPSFSLKTVEQSVNTWSGSDRPSFRLSLLFVALRGDEDITLPIQTLYKAVFPEIIDVALGQVIIPPLKYLPQGRTARGTVLVRIGKWFQATNLLIEKVDFTFSKETLPSGRPLYAQGSVSFVPYRVLSAEEINQWFIA